MSAPDTSVKRQERQHLPSLIAIAISVLFGLVMGFAIAWTAIDRADAPDENVIVTTPDAGAVPDAGASQ